jgi:hypothetical protein
MPGTRYEGSRPGEKVTWREDNAAWYEKCEDRYSPQDTCTLSDTISPTEANYACSGIAGQTLSFRVNPKTGAWVKTAREDFGIGQGSKDATRTEG